MLGYLDVITKYNFHSPIQFLLYLFPCSLVFNTSFFTLSNYMVSMGLKNNTYDHIFSHLTTDAQIDYPITDVLENNLNVSYQYL